MIVTRFAPSPTGRLHLGHAYAALYAARAGDRFLLRLEDIDAGRSRPEFVDGIYEDLAWLGLRWEEPVRRQSQHMNEYAAAIDVLRGKGVIYPCFCTRADIAAAADAPHGPDGAIYPGTCRSLDDAERTRQMAEGKPYAWRLDVGKALSSLPPAHAVGGGIKGGGLVQHQRYQPVVPHPPPLTPPPAKAQEGENLWWRDRTRGPQGARPELLGDVVLARKDTPASYHLCVTLDDHLQGVSLVTRGEDLFHATHVHRLLQALLDLDVPEWDHHKLLLDAHGQRFAKRNESVTLRALRESGRTATDVRAMVGL